jgi:nucleotide-binding universal stress UspA family protein
MKILLAIDDSEYSAAAVKEVAKRPWPKVTTVRVLTLVEPFPAVAIEPWYGARESLERIDDAEKKRARELTNKAADTLKKAGIKAQSTIRQGDPRSEIVEEAEESRADLIIMGSHGFTGIKRWLLGSVASSVVSHAPCSVEVVRLKPKKKPGQ